MSGGMLNTLLALAEVTPTSAKTIVVHHCGQENEE